MCKENTIIRIDLLPEPIQKEFRCLLEINEQLSNVEDDIEHCWTTLALLEQCLSDGDESNTQLSMDIVIKTLHTLQCLSDILYNDFRKVQIDYQHFFENKKIENVSSELKGGACCE